MDDDKSDIYQSRHYSKVMGSGALLKQWARIHRAMEQPYKKKVFHRILELGAGEGQHRPFVRSAWTEYHETDIRVDILKTNSTEQEGVMHSMQDIQNITFPEDFFDRIIVSCVLVHVANPLTALEEIKRVSNNSCRVSIYLPCEPGLLLRIARSFTTIPKNRRLGVEDPYFIHFQEHRNYFTAMNHFILNTFDVSKIKSKYFPFPFLSWNFNLYKIYQIEVNKSPTEC
jgi:phosphatidylethanolamine/phosphatidyl-N-methylethanolamine N-methyltransferase